MILDEEIFFRECEGRVELNVIRESSPLTGIHFCSFKCSVNVRLYFHRFLWLLKAFEEIKHHFTCKTF